MIFEQIIMREGYLIHLQTDLVWWETELLLGKPSALLHNTELNNEYTAVTAVKTCSG